MLSLQMNAVQLDHHGRLCFRKENEQHLLKQQPKHAAKIHIWGVISMKGATRLVMFSGFMTARDMEKLAWCHSLKLVIQMGIDYSRIMILKVHWPAL